MRLPWYVNRLIFLGCVTLFVAVRPITINSAYERIEIGMTKAEVISIIGLPEGHYASSPEIQPFSISSRGVRIDAPPNPDHLEWCFNECGIEVFLEKGKVVRKWQFDTTCSPEYRSLTSRARYSLWWIFR